MKEAYIKRVQNKLKKIWESIETIPEDQQAIARMSAVEEAMDKLSILDETGINTAIDAVEKNNVEAENNINKGQDLMIQGQKELIDNYSKAYEALMKL